MTTTRRGSTRSSSPGARASGRGRFARSRRVALAALVSLPAVSTSIAQEPTRGVGVYPGDPAESFAPALVPDTTTYRNLALRRPAYHSSSRDYNLTAQLVTDGIPAAGAPRWLSTATQPARDPAQAGAGVPRRSQLDEHPRPGRDRGRGCSSSSGAAPRRRASTASCSRSGRAASRVRLPSPFPMPGDGAPASGRSRSPLPTTGAPGRRWATPRDASSPRHRCRGLATGPRFETWFRAANPRLKPEIALDEPLQSRFYRVALRSTGGERVEPRAGRVLRRGQARRGRRPVPRSPAPGCRRARARSGSRSTSARVHVRPRRPPLGLPRPPRGSCRSRTTVRSGATCSRCPRPARPTTTCASPRPQAAATCAC